MLGWLNKRFRGNADTPEFWRLSSILEFIEQRFGQAELVGERGVWLSYGVVDGQIRFIIGLRQFGPGKVDMINFAALFSQVSVEESDLEELNRFLQISIAWRHSSGNLIIASSVGVTGDFDNSTFTMIIEAWRRDLMVAVHVLSGKANLEAAFAVLADDKVREFAINQFPHPDGAGKNGDMFAQLYGDAPSAMFCPTCGGRGRSGLIARICRDCNGLGTKRSITANGI